MITINGKTYKQLHNKYSIDWLLKHGYLEELKPLSQKRAEQIERGENEVISTSAKNPILEKLREELEKIIADYSKRGMRDGDHMDYWVDGKVWGLKEALDLLASLETPQFTPGQEIERACREKLGQDIVLASNDSWQERIDKENYNSEAREIHFRPITLQDILLCLGENFCVMGNGDIMKWEVNNEVELAGWIDMGIKYNLNLSPYDQSEEVLQFLAENLTK